MKKNLLRKALLPENQIKIILFVTATSINFLLIPTNHMNLLNILMMGIVAFLFVAKGCKMEKFDLSYFILIILMLGMSYRFPSTFKLSSILYTGMYFITFIYAYQLLKKSALSAVDYRKYLRLLIKLYFIVLIIQQLCILLGLPVFNYTFGSSADQEFRVNALAAEPSHAASIVFLLMYSYILISEIIMGRKMIFLKDWKHDKKLWYMFAYCMLSFGSTTGILLFLILLIRLTNVRNSVYVVIFLIFSGWVAYQVQPVAFERSINFVKAMSTMDPQRVNEVDHSAAYRVIPAMVYTQEFDLFSSDFWFGSGRNSDIQLFGKYLKDGDIELNYGGIYPSFILYYGFISFLLMMIIYSRYCIRKVFSIDFILFFQLAILGGWNQQGWALCMILFMSNKYFEIKNSKKCTYARKCE